MLQFYRGITCITCRHAHWLIAIISELLILMFLTMQRHIYSAFVLWKMWRQGEGGKLGGSGWVEVSSKTLDKSEKSYVFCINIAAQINP
jgi:hypothetical protein